MYFCAHEAVLLLQLVVMVSVWTEVTVITVGLAMVRRSLLRNLLFTTAPVNPLMSTWSTCSLPVYYRCCDKTRWMWPPTISVEIFVRSFDRWPGGNFHRSPRSLAVVCRPLDCGSIGWPENWEWVSHTLIGHRLGCHLVMKVNLNLVVLEYSATVQ